MPRPRQSEPPASTSFPVRASLSGGNGKPHSDSERIARIEALIESLQQTLDIQLRRTAAMQVELDRINAKRSNR